MEYTPINLGINTANPLDGYLQGLQDRAKLDLAKAQTNQANAQTDAFQQKTIADNLKAQAEAQQQAQNQVLIQKLVSPTATVEDYKAYALANPTSPNALKVWEQKDKDQKLAILQPASQIGVALKAGNTQLALDTINNSIEAFTNSGDTQNAGVLGVLKKTIEEHPDLALAGVLTSLMQVDGGDKIVGQILGKPQADIAQTQAQTNQANAMAAKAKADAVGQNISNLYAPQKTALDLQNTQSTINKNIADIANTQSQIDERGYKISNPALSTTAEKLINDSVEKINTNSQAINNINSIQGSIDVLKKQYGGTWTKAGDFIARFFGSDGEWQNIKAQLAQVNFDKIKSNKLAGAYSDKDVELVKTTTISEDSDPQVIERYLNSSKKILEADNKIQQNQTDWVSANGNLGTARKDLEINGVLVPKGTKFSDFNKAPISGKSYLKY